MHSNLLVTGASGHLGRRVVEILLENHPGSIIAATRTPEKLGDLAAQGVQVRYADFNSPASLITAFDGADRLLLVSTNALAVPGERVKRQLNAIAAAESVGIKHLVYTSGMGAGPYPEPHVLGQHYSTEIGLRSSSLDWTVLRNNCYAESILEFLPAAIEIGHITASARDGDVSWVSREDCAQTAAAALASDFIGKRTLDVTGPDAVSYSELAGMASKISGRKVDYVRVGPEMRKEILVDAGTPDFMALTIVAFEVATAAGLLATVSRTVFELTGTEPGGVRDFLRRALPTPAMAKSFLL